MEKVVFVGPHHLKYTVRGWKKFFDRLLGVGGEAP